ncbi:MAG: DUF2089 family protein [Erysipelotrichaceae bacterium]
MRKEVIGTCPVCQNSLLATRLSCNVCHTEITGEFELSRFSYLNKEELNFIETFIRVYGNIKEMEKELDVSYPTVKKMLEQVVTKMGFETRDSKEPNPNTEDILTKIKNKEISVNEALTLLKK